MRLAVLALAAAVVGCASTEPVTTLQEGAPSYVAHGVTPAEAQTLALAATGVALGRLNGPVRLVAAPDPDPVAPLLAGNLRAAGAKVAEPGAAASHRLSYRISALDQGLVLKVMIDSAMAAQPFARSPNALRPAGPFTVVETAP